jgi:acetoin utilization deacetylase AcuC-like enzyme
MTTLGLVLDPVFKRHDTGFGHPERPARIDAVTAGLERAGLVARATRIAPRPIERDALERIHDARYIDRVEAACRAGRPFIDDADCAIGPQSFEIGLLAAGAVVDAARALASGRVKRAFCAVRPPGHHAERDRSMGFCLFGNVALAADVVRREFGLKRILILDWDVHHGNGTQHIFEADSEVLFVSLHGHPDHLYPGTGYAHETGVGPGTGYTINIPLLPGSGDAEYRAAFADQVEPAVEKFAPQFIIVSVGFDAHADDPLSNLRVSDEGYIWMGRRVLDWARRFSSGRVLSVLEGGYNLDVLSRCVAEHVQLLEETR